MSNVSKTESLPLDDLRPGQFILCTRVQRREARPPAYQDSVVGPPTEPAEATHLYGIPMRVRACQLPFVVLDMVVSQTGSPPLILDLRGIIFRYVKANRSYIRDFIRAPERVRIGALDDVMSDPRGFLSPYAPKKRFFTKDEP